MEIDKVLEVLNNALRDKDMTIWLRDEELKMARNEIELLKEKIKELRGKTNE